MIIEGRLNNVEKKFPLLTTKYNGKSLIDMFAENDPSGNNKYLMWMAHKFFKLLTTHQQIRPPNLSDEELDKFVKKTYEEMLPSLVGDEHRPMGVPIRLGRAPDKIIQTVKAFHTILPYVKTKDIYSYNSISELMDGIKDAKDRKKIADQKKAIKKGAKSGGSVVYENEYGLTVVRVDTTEAACFFGKNTRWCIAARNENQFENYTSQGYVFYYVLNPKHEERDNQKFAVLFNPRSPSRTVFAAQPIPVSEIFDAADDVVGPSTLFKSLVSTGLLGDPEGDEVRAKKNRRETTHGRFDEMMDTLSAHAYKNPPKMSLTAYLDVELDTREIADQALGGWQVKTTRVFDYVEDTPSQQKENRKEAAIRIRRRIIYDLPFEVFSTLMKALVTSTKGKQLKTGPGQQLPEFNMQFYAKVRDEYIKKARVTAEKFIEEFMKQQPDDAPEFTLENQGRLFVSDEEEDIKVQARIKDVRFFTKNETAVRGGIYRPTPGDDRANFAASMDTAFDSAMVNVARQWEGNPNAIGDVFGKDGMTKYTLRELWKFARDRYAPSYHFDVELFPESEEILTQKRAPNTHVPLSIIPHSMEPQFYIVKSVEEVDSYLDKIEDIQDLFYRNRFNDKLREALEDAGIYKTLNLKNLRRGRNISGQRGFDFKNTEKKKHVTGRVDENKTISRWKKIVNK